MLLWVARDFYQFAFFPFSLLFTNHNTDIIQLRNLSEYEPGGVIFLYIVSQFTDEVFKRVSSRNNHKNKHISFIWTRKSIFQTCFGPDIFDQRFIKPFQWSDFFLSDKVRFLSLRQEIINCRSIPVCKAAKKIHSFPTEKNRFEKVPKPFGFRFDHFSRDSRSEGNFEMNRPT